MLFIPPIIKRAVITEQKFRVWILKRNMGKKLIGILHLIISWVNMGRWKYTNLSYYRKSFHRSGSSFRVLVWFQLHYINSITLPKRLFLPNPQRFWGLVKQVNCINQNTAKNTYVLYFKYRHHISFATWIIARINVKLPNSSVTLKIIHNFINCIPNQKVCWFWQSKKFKILGNICEIQKAYFVHEGWNFNSGNYLFTTDTK